MCCESLTWCWVIVSVFPSSTRWCEDSFKRCRTTHTHTLDFNTAGGLIYLLHNSTGSVLGPCLHQMTHVLPRGHASRERERDGVGGVALNTLTCGSLWLQKLSDGRLSFVNERLGWSTSLFLSRSAILSCLLSLWALLRCFRWSIDALVKGGQTLVIKAAGGVCVCVRLLLFSVHSRIDHCVKPMWPQAVLTHSNDAFHTHARTHTFSVLANSFVWPLCKYNSYIKSSG